MAVTRDQICPPCSGSGNMITRYVFVGEHPSCKACGGEGFLTAAEVESWWGKFLAVSNGRTLTRPLENSDITEIRP